MRSLMPLGLALVLPACNLPVDPFNINPFAPDAGADGPIVRTERPPTAISGGTLTAQGNTLIVADTDRDRVLGVDLTEREVLFEINDLPEPGRSIFGSDGQVHVLLRGSGEVFSFDLDAPEAGTRSPVCGAPRGLVELADGAIWIACAGGTVHALDPETHTTHLVGRPAGDLRDLARVGNRVFVSRLRAAEVLELGAHAEILRTIRPQGSNPDQEQAAVAWRLSATGDGRLALAHQMARTGGPLLTQSYYTTVPAPCGELVGSALTVFRPDEDRPAVGGVPAFPLPVDFALDDAGGAAVVSAGRRGSASARRMTPQPGHCADPAAGLPVSEGARSVAVARGIHAYVFQSMDPPRLDVVPDPPEPGQAAGVRHQPWSLALGGRISADAGHNLFHDATGANIACASCHPEGGDDGQVWAFQGAGERRTQYLAGGLAAPFHWTGDLNNFKTFCDDVLTGRMAGPQLDDASASRFATWIDSLPAPPLEAPADEAAAERGAEVFAAAACGVCHRAAGDGQNHDVGTGGPFQTPPLRALVQRLPLMHDGCAATIADRFRPECGGAQHGNVAGLSADQIADLVAYLETL